MTARTPFVKTPLTSTCMGSLGLNPVRLTEIFIFFLSPRLLLFVTVWASLLASMLFLVGYNI